MNPSKNSNSVGQTIKKLYEAIFNEIYSQIKNQKIGVLSTVIYTLYDSEEPLAKTVCEYLQIEKKASLEDDLSISSDIVALFINNPNDKQKSEWINNNIIQPVKNLRKSVSNLEDNDMKLFQIVVIGCLILGTGYCLKYLEKTKQGRTPQKSRKIQPSASPPPKQKDPISVALCLVVPASVLGNLRENNQVSVSDIENLIDNSSYFLCTSLENANAIEESHLELTEEDITAISEQREVYIRFDISDGEEILGKTVPYILKRNLPSHGQRIKKCGCLKYLSVSGLEKFNRV